MIHFKVAGSELYNEIRSGKPILFEMPSYDCNNRAVRPGDKAVVTDKLTHNRVAGEIVSVNYNSEAETCNVEITPPAIEMAFSERKDDSDLKYVS